MKYKILLPVFLIALTPALSGAISIGTISDSLSHQLSNSKTQPTYTAAIPKQMANNTSSGTKPAPTETTEQSFPNPALFIEDAAMTAYIQSQLLLKKDIPTIKVSTDNAVVSLIGTVDTKEQADTIVKIASSVKGVKGVKTDQLVIRKN